MNLDFVGLGSWRRGASRASQVNIYVGWVDQVVRTISEVNSKRHTQAKPKPHKGAESFASHLKDVWCVLCQKEEFCDMGTSFCSVRVRVEFRQRICTKAGL